MTDRPWLDGVLADLLDYHGSALFIHRPDGRLDDLSSDFVGFLEVRRLLMRRGELAIGLRIGREVVLSPAPEQRFDRASITGVIVIGAGIGWNTDNTQARVADLTA